MSSVNPPERVSCSSTRVDRPMYSSMAPRGWRRGGAGSGRRAPGRRRRWRRRAPPPRRRGRARRTSCRHRPRAKSVGGRTMPRSARSWAKEGRSPVGTSRPRNRPFASRPALKSKVNRSCRVMTSPSMPTTSLIAVTLRVPSLSRACWMTRSSAPATWSRMARTGRSMPAMRTIVSRRERLSRGVFACTVVSEPSWPVFIAWSMSRAAPSRTSPTTIRSGRMRSEFFTSSRMLIRPRPSMLAGRDSRRSTWCWRSWSSAASSMVTMRSSSGMKLEMTLSSVVLPEPVPPEMTMLRRPRTQAARKSRTSGVKVPKLTRSASVKGSVANLRMVSMEPSRAIGETTALTREPSGRRASTSGLPSSTRRPTRPTMRSMTRRRWPSSTKRRSLRTSRPARST